VEKKGKEQAELRNMKIVLYWKKKKGFRNKKQKEEEKRYRIKEGTKRWR